MKIALSWLESYFLEKPDWDLVLNRLTQAGIEVENFDKGVVELKITPNRGDCLSIIGLLREISALTSYKYKVIENQSVANLCNSNLDIIIDDDKVCPNYVGLVINGINNQQKLPAFILDRLLCSGFRSVSPIIDITNYVMLELGQPLHAFDLDKVGTKLVVRFAKSSEKIKLIDETEVEISSDTLIIADANNIPVAIAGVMGGVDSSVTFNTQNIILESAFFDPHVIAGKAKQYGVNSDAAYRFERGVDRELQQFAILYVANLITKYLGGNISDIFNYQSNNLSYSRTIVVKFNDFVNLIGVSIDIAAICKILDSLGFKVLDISGEVISLLIPSFRFDVSIKEDIIEEVARVYGYENIQATLPKLNYTMQEINLAQLNMDSAKLQLVSRGYNEIVSYAFLEDSYNNLFQSPDLINEVKLKNPIAGLSTMRSTLFAGLIKVLQYNINRGVDSIKIFELAKVFYAEDLDSQLLKLSGLIYGKSNKLNWIDVQRDVDFFDIKGDLEVLLSSLGDLKFVVCVDYPILHAGRCAKIYAGEKQVGIVGQLHPLIGQKLGLKMLPYMFELDVKALINSHFNFKFKTISKFPKVERDLAFLVDKFLNVAVLIDYIKSLSIDYLYQVEVFDVYQGSNVLNGCKSVAIKLLFQSNKNLTEEEIGISLKYIVKQVEQNLQVKLR